MKTRRALIAGLAGSLAMSGAVALLQTLGLNISFEAMLGSMVGTHYPWLTGFAIHLAIGMAAGWLYAAAFEYAVQSAGPFVGAGFGLSHGLLAGLFMSGIADMNPFGSMMYSAPGAFFSNAAANVFFGPLLFIGLHVLFGAMVGVAYGEPVQKPHVFTRETA
jgi:hypothetical protein